MKKYVQVFVCFLVGVLPILGQAPFQNTMINQGVLTISSEAVVSTSYDFDNTATGQVNSDGTIYYYSHFNNDNLYYYSNPSPTAKAIFTPLEFQSGHQQISGNRPSDFYHIVLDNPTPIMGFDLKNEVNVKGSMEFKDGIIQVDSLQGMLTFHQGAQALNPTDKSHAQGYVEKIGKEPFTFPIGDKSVYRYARISAPVAEKEAYQSKYILNDHDFFKNHSNKDASIEQINTKEYWRIDKSTANKGDIMLTLSWDERTTDSRVLNQTDKELHLVRWDEQAKQWKDLGGVVAMDAKEITTPATIEDYGYFTFAIVDHIVSNSNDLEIYNLVTPNGDGKNDYFYIKNIQAVPTNNVAIYNRWGIKVFETDRYDTSDNVFRGYSEGRVTINKGERLPSGTYFYILTYEKSTPTGSSVIKKSGYLHLETE